MYHHVLNLIVTRNINIDSPIHDDQFNFPEVYVRSVNCNRTLLFINQVFPETKLQSTHTAKSNYIQKTINKNKEMAFFKVKTYLEVNPKIGSSSLASCKYHIPMINTDIIKQITQKIGYKIEKTNWY